MRHEVDRNRRGSRIAWHCSHGSRGGVYRAGLGKKTLRPGEWFTVSADYQPERAADPLMVKRVADKVVDRFFEEANDMVVPTEGCHSPGPPVRDSLRLQGGVVHLCNYFAAPAVHDKLDALLQ